MSDTPTPDWDPHSDAVQRDQLAAYDALREQCPVAYSESMGWTLFRHADVSRVLRDHKTFSNVVSRHLSVPNGMDPPEHTAYRQIIEPYFAPQPMAAFEPRCRAIASRLTQRLSGQHEVELIAELALPFAVQIQCAFMGWPDSMHEPLVRWTLNNQQATRTGDRGAMRHIAQEFESLIDEMLACRRRAGVAPDEDVTAALMHEKIDGRPMRDAEITSILRNWTAGEIGTISASIGILGSFLAHHPDVQQQLREEHARLPQAIDEILRIQGPLVSNRRTTTCPVEIGGRRIDAGERVTLIWVSANRDAQAFAEPDVFQLDRDQQHNLLYGDGIHVCPGAPLARMEMRIVMEELLQRTQSIEPATGKTAINAVYPASGFEALPLCIR